MRAELIKQVTAICRRVIPFALAIVVLIFAVSPSASAFDGESAVLRTYRVGINEPANWFHLLVDDDSYFFVLESNGYGTYEVRYLGNNQIEIRFYVEYANVPEGFLVSPQLYRLNYPNGEPRLDLVEFTDGVAGEGYAVYIYAFEFVTVSTSSITCAFGPNLAYTIDNLDFYTHEVYFAGDVDYRDLIAALEGIEKEQNTFYAWFQKTWEPFRVSLVKSLQNLADIGNNVISRLGQIRDYIIDGFKVQSSFFDWYKSAWTMTYNAVTGFFNTWQTKLQGWFSSVTTKLDELITAVKDGTPEMQDKADQMEEDANNASSSLGSASDALGSVSQPEVNIDSVIPGELLGADFVNYTNVITVVWQNDTLVSMVTIMVGFLLLSLLLNGQRK